MVTKTLNAIGNLCDTIDNKTWRIRNKLSFNSSMWIVLRGIWFVVVLFSSLFFGMAIIQWVFTNLLDWSTPIGTM